MGQKIQTITELRRYLRNMFQRAFTPDESAAMATLIIKEYTGIGEAMQLAGIKENTDHTAAASILSAGERAAAGEPLQYIFGYTIFCGHRIEVFPGVLIPRPETEEMTMMAISENRGCQGSALDLCTGSGCIAVSLASALRGTTVYATDISDTALLTASRNARINNVSINMLRKDILSSGTDDYPPCNILCSNPPYVRENEKPLMRKNVLDYEPHKALFVPDNDPLLFYRHISAIAEKCLLPGGKMYLEINEALPEETAALFRNPSFTDIEIIKDINGKMRIIKATKNG